MPDPFSAYATQGTLSFVAAAADARLPCVRWLHGPIDAAHLPRVSFVLESYRLPRPFLQVHHVAVSERAAEVVSDAFVGVSAARAAVALRQLGRRLPLDVWLGLADRLIEALGSLELHHAWWRTWAGPHTFGVDLSGDFVLFAGFHGHAMPWDALQMQLPSRVEDLHSDWLDVNDHHGYGTPMGTATRAWSVCRVLTWLLDPFPFQMELLHARGELPWEHPEVSKALAAVLEQGLARRFDDGLPALRNAITDTAGVTPAPLERIKAVLFGAAEQALVARVREVSEHDEALPSAWKGGGALVLLDGELEHAANVAQFPSDPRRR
jgi:hypothetical protein